jgi:uncharacterized protein (DUF885 family)
MQARFVVLPAVVATLLTVMYSPSGRVAAAPSGDAALERAVDDLVADLFRRNPTMATQAGIHDYDDRLEDLSKAAIAAEIDALKQFRARFAAIDAGTLSVPNQLDREQVLAAIDSRLLDLDVIKPWATNPDIYSSSVTETAFVMITRAFAPAEVRLKALVARERQMVALLDEARRNLENPPAIYTAVALEQIDGNREFFATSVPEAFASVGNETLLAEFKEANQAVLNALDRYKAFLEELQSRSHGAFAIGAENLRAKFRADELVDAPLDRLLGIAEADLARNQAAFAEAAAKVGPGRPPGQVLASIAADHPPPDRLLTVTQQGLDDLRRFIVSKDLLTIPSDVPARVEETPPFLRALTSASMDTPGPFEKVATEAYYNMTLPDPSWPADRVESFMRQWYPAMISNVSVHEVYPGHYTQFLYGPMFPSKVRKVFGASTNAEGWAHYAEQMMLDEGLGGGDPKLRLAQLQDALLRDVRFIAGIKLHSAGMTVDEAQQLFEREAHQPPPVAQAEARRGTADPTYGYYTLGKLMILKLRDDYRASRGPAYSIKAFHDAFLRLGPLPLPLVRRAMLGAAGDALP